MTGWLVHLPFKDEDMAIKKIMPKGKYKTDISNANKALRMDSRCKAQSIV